jgi:hypothetical protein
MHDPCACILSLVWDVSEQAYYRCFLSTDGKTKKKIWMSKPIGSMATINFNGGKKKRKERDEKEREEEDCAGKDQSTQKHGYCCHQHAKVAKTEEQEEEKKQRKLQKGKLDKFVDGPDHCIHVMKNCASSSKLNCDCVRMTKYTSTRQTTTKILWRTTAVGANVHTSTQRSSYGKASTIGSPTTGALKLEFGPSFLPSMGKKWVTNPVKILLSDIITITK